MNRLAFAFEGPRPFANSNPPVDPYLQRPPLHKVKDEVLTSAQRPTTGRTTRLGRKVEKPSDNHTDGPSGQRDLTRHDKKHANK